MSQGQNITLKIAGKEFALKASSPEMERAMRLSAEQINASLAKYDQKFPGKPLEDKLIFVCLNETVGKILMQNRVSALSVEVNSLKEETDAYLKDIEK